MGWRSIAAETGDDRTPHLDRVEVPRERALDRERVVLLPRRVARVGLELREQAVGARNPVREEDEEQRELDQHQILRLDRERIAHAPELREPRELNETHLAAANGRRETRTAVREGFAPRRDDA